MLVVHPVILKCLIVCLILLIAVIFDQYFLRWLKNAMIGAVCIYICDLFLPITWQVGISIFTVLFTALLGIPGILILYLFSICIK
ncbi:MAG: pro-sigmaK processing inhibitor BofA family protein [Candidatus Niameybacter stercoravium]|nr:pro-sigmaK processing inhibitor BofA family protein [Candidatus Niameybacter stercoravium]